MKKFSVEKKLRLLYVLTGLTVCFIWINSVMPGEISSGFSNFVRSIMDLFFGGDGTATEGTGLLRKLGHITEFTVLGVEISLIFRLKLKTDYTSLIFVGVSTALIDETIQLFVEGRSGMVQDIWIDLGGFTLGVFVILLINNIRKRVSS